MSARGARAAGAEVPAALGIGLVVAAHGRHVVVETPERERVLCHPRGKKSELVVGDRVRWQATGDGGVVEQIEPRRNLLFRQDEWRTKSFAANLDQILMLVAGEPVFSEAQLTRALLAAQDAGIPALIGLNKTDLPATAAARERLAPYRAMGVEVIELALKADPVGSSARLLAHLAGRTTLVLGASRHTTTTSTWYWLDHEHRGALIDTPGFQEFGLRHIEPDRLATLMPDFAAALGHCRFHNCSHRHEPGCGVRAAMARGEISASRQRIYEMLFEELSRPRW